MLTIFTEESGTERRFEFSPSKAIPSFPVGLFEVLQGESSEARGT